MPEACRRPAALSALLALDEAGKPVDRGALTSTIDRSNAGRHPQAADCGIDIASDGEHSRVSYLTYVPRRMRGFGGESKRPIPRDMVDFPEFDELYQRERLAETTAFRAPMAIGEIHCDDCSAVNEECTAFGRALTAADATFRKHLRHRSPAGAPWRTLACSERGPISVRAPEASSAAIGHRRDDGKPQADAPRLGKCPGRDLPRPWPTQDRSLRSFPQRSRQHRP